MNVQEIQNGVGPYPGDWPKGEHFDPELLKYGDRRNVIDAYRYWTVDAIKADLDKRRLPLEIAIENVGRDFNMGTIIRNANAFNIAKVHVIGSRQWNKRGAMRTDLYMHIEYHKDVRDFIAALHARGRTVIAVDIVPGARPIQEVDLDDSTVLVFGAEGPGISPALLEAADDVVMIQQAGSTRSVNVGVASGIALYEWVSRRD